MDILEQIVRHKRKEVEERGREVDIRALEKERFFNRPVYSLSQSVADPKKTGIIAEYKRRSPSRGIINDRDSVESVTRMYAAFGASGISVLTDHDFFGGSLEDLTAARDNNIPLLRKDFMISEYQIIEAKAFGADVVLLIAACLSPREVKDLAQTAKRTGLEVLLELHDETELDHICDEIDLVGVNNRNLRNFQVDLEHSVRMAEKIGSGHVKIAESGINDVNNINYLKSKGFQGFLIGEYFMRQQDPGKAFKEFTYLL